MRFIFEEDRALDSLKHELGSVTQQILSQVLPQRQALRIPANSDLSSLNDGAGFYVLQEGMLTASVDNRTLFVFEEGDIVFPQSTWGINSVDTALEIRSDFATVCDFYLAEQFFGKKGIEIIGLRYLSLQQALMSRIIALLFKGEKQTTPAIRAVKAGQAIVTEGEISDQVFTLLEGHAEVSVGGQQVGEVKADELVGVIGALCGIPRIATVTASKDSLLMSLAKDEFVELLSLRPHTVVKLIEDFARIISSSNQELRELKRQ